MLNAVQAARLLLAARARVDNRLRVEDRFLGGRGSGNFGHEGRPGERGGSGEEDSRSARALATYKPSTRAKQQEAEKSANTVAKLLGGTHTDDHSPMDVVVRISGRTNGIEVKTLIDQKNDKITMHPESLARKVAWVKANKAEGHTVVVDRRGTAPVYYYKRGFGSFRIGALQKVRSSELRSMLK